MNNTPEDDDLDAYCKAIQKNRDENPMEYYRCPTCGTQHVRSVRPVRPEGEVEPGKVATNRVTHRS